MLITLAEDLNTWRATLVQMRGTNDAEVEAVIDRLDASSRSVSALLAADGVDSVVR
jgi:hypothetical protein